MEILFPLIIHVVPNTLVIEDNCHIQIRRVNIETKFTLIK